MKPIRMLISAVHFLGALAVVFVTGPALLTAMESVYNWPVVIAVAAYLVTAILSGVWLWRNERRGYVAAIIVQISHIPVIISSWFSVKAYLGLGITLFFYGRPWHLAIQFGVETVLTYDSPATPVFIGVNVLAVATTAVLVWCMKTSSGNLKERSA